MEYEMETTFWNDFTIADLFGAKGVRDTYRVAHKSWKDNVEYYAELVLVLNWRCWQHYENGNEALSRLYAELYHKSNDYALEHFTGDDAAYYCRVTD